MFRRGLFVGCLLLGGILLPGGLSADIKFFWLDRPSGRFNPHDPASTQYKNALPTTTPTNTPVGGATATASPTATVTATYTPSPTATAPANLTVKVQDNQQMPVPGTWVELAGDSGTAKLVDAAGQAVFLNPSEPIEVDIFPPTGCQPQVLSYTNVSGSLLVAQVSNPADTSSPVKVTLTVSLTTQSGSAAYVFQDCAPSGYEASGTGSGLNGNPALGSFPLPQGDIAMFNAFEFNAGLTAFTAAVFVPPVTMNASITISAATDPGAGWATGTLPVTYGNTLAGEAYTLQAWGGASATSTWTLPMLGPGGWTGTLASTAPFTTYGPVLYPTGAAFIYLGCLADQSGAYPLHHRRVGATYGAFPSAVTAILPNPLQWSVFPTAGNPQCVVLNPDSSAEAAGAVQVYNTVSSAVEWEFITQGVPAGAALSAHYPALPPAVTWLTPFVAGPLRVADAMTVSFVSPVNMQQPLTGGPEPTLMNEVDAQY